MDQNDVYHSHREQLIRGEQEQSILFDKTLIALASGAFGLSFVLMKSIGVPTESIWAMIVAWIFLLASVCSTLTSFIFSQKAFRQEWVELDKREANPSSGLAKSQNLYSEIVRFLNWLSLIAFIAGAIFMAAFAALHFTRG